MTYDQHGTASSCRASTMTSLELECPIDRPADDLGCAGRLVAQRHGVGGYNHFPDRPQRQPRKFQVRPSEGNADDRDRKEKGGDQMAQRKPPACEHKPNDVAKHSERPGAYVFIPRISIARHRLLAEWKEGIKSDIERRACPGQADNSDCHDDGCNNPRDRHPEPAGYDPEHVEQEGQERHWQDPGWLRSAKSRY